MDCSGQKVHYPKSQLFFSKNVDINLACQLSKVSRIPLTSNLGRYLGVNSIHGRLGISSPMLLNWNTSTPGLKV